MSKDISIIDDDISMYGLFKGWLKRKKSSLIIIILLFTMSVAFFWDFIIITIKPGEAGILFQRFSGTKIDTVYGEGLHIISPWDTLHIYEVRKQVAFHDFDVISIKGLNIKLSLAVRYRPEYELLGILHQRIGPDYLDRVILPQIESVMRKELGNYTAEEIYTNEKGLLTNTILTALEEVGRNYVEVEDIIIRSLALPADIVTAIEDKLKQEEFMKSYEFRLQTAQKEADRLAIEAQGINQYHKVLSESLTNPILRHKGIIATEQLSMSPNAKVVVIGGGKDGLPIILGNDYGPAPTPATSPISSKNNTSPLSPVPPILQKADGK